MNTIHPDILARMKDVPHPASITGKRESKETDPRKVALAREAANFQETDLYKHLREHTISSPSRPTIGAPGITMDTDQIAIYRWGQSSVLNYLDHLVKLLDDPIQHTN